MLPFGRLLARRRAEPQSVPVGIDYRHLTGLPLGVARRLCGLYATPANLAKQRIDVVNQEIGGAANLAVARMLGQEEGQPVTSQLRKHGQTGFEPVLPIHVETEAIDVEGTRALPVGHAQLREDALSHRRLRHGAQSTSCEATGQAGGVDYAVPNLAVVVRARRNAENNFRGYWRRRAA